MFIKSIYCVERAGDDQRQCGWLTNFRNRLSKFRKLWRHNRHKELVTVGLPKIIIYNCPFLFICDNDLVNRLYDVKPTLNQHWFNVLCLLGYLCWVIYIAGCIIYIWKRIYHPRNPSPYCYTMVSLRYIFKLVSGVYKYPTMQSCRARAWFVQLP